MKPYARQLLLIATLACLCTFGYGARAQEREQAPTAQEAAESLDVETETAAEPEDEDADAAAEDTDRSSHHGDVILHFSDDSHLRADDTAGAVISIFGSSLAEGEVDEAVVSVFGDTRTKGRVGGDAVAVFGNTYVDGRVRHDVLAVFGDVELGPNADVGGDVVSVGGSIIRDPAAIVDGASKEVYLGGVGKLEGLKIWIEKCLLYGRPLAFEPGLGWAWSIALGLLALYVAIALLFPGSVQKCVSTLEQQPGQSVLASVLTVLLTPVLMLLLMISVIGIGFIPFLSLGLFCASMFGKAVILGALGRRITIFTGIGAFGHIAFAVLVGGLILLVLYVVPVLGYITYQLTGILGLGVVVYTLLLILRARRDSVIVTPQPAAAAPATAAPIDPMSAASAGTASLNEPMASTSATTAAADAATAYPRAGFMIRMGALLIDAVLLGIIISVLDPPGEVFLLGLAIYGAAMWKLKSTTIGGIVCNLRVVRLDGREMSWDTAIVRALGCFLSLAFAGLGFLWILFDEGRQSWHDKIAGTVVVRTPKGTPLL